MFAEAAWQLVALQPSAPCSPRLESILRLVGAVARSTPDHVSRAQWVCPMGGGRLAHIGSLRHEVPTPRSCLADRGFA